MARPTRSAFYDRFRLHVYLRRPQPNGFYQVRIVCYFHGTDFSVSPGLLILPSRKKGRGMQELFEPKTGRVLADHPEADHINEQLGLWEKRLRAAFHSRAKWCAKPCCSLVSGLSGVGVVSAACPVGIAKKVISNKK